MEVGREGEDRYRVWCGEEEERKKEGGERRGRRRMRRGKWEERERRKVKGRVRGDGMQIGYDYVERKSHGGAGRHWERSIY